MLNKDIFKEYNTENWVIEENLCYLLQGKTKTRIS